MGIFQDYYASKTRRAQQGTATLPQTTEQPQIDTSNAIASLAQLMGPTPAEREAQERRLQESRAKMQGWTAFFDGMRQLGNLYYTTKGARPQHFNDNSYQLVDNSIQSERKRVDDLANYRRQYAAALYNLRRQANDDRRKDALSKTQLEYYKTRDEQSVRKTDISEFKARTDADYKKATLEQKNALNEVKLRLMEGQISKVEAERQYKLIMASNAQKGTETTVTKSDGTVTTTVRKPAGSTGNRYSQYKKGSSGKGSSSGKYDQYKINK